jgi:hypothetical protein
MPLTFAETQGVAALARHLYDYLPGSSYGDRAYSFANAAHDARVPQFWQGGSKEPAIASLLELTLERQRSSFCPLIETIVRAGLKYRARKGIPMTRGDLVELNRLVATIGFKIPSLWDSNFAATLPDVKQSPPVVSPSSDVAANTDHAIFARGLGELMARFLTLNAMADRQRAGRELEALLHDLFAAFGLEPRGAFVVVGEQIDGSIVLDGNSYLVEAKWEEGQVGLAPLMTFREKVSGKSSMTYGVFLSMNGYSDGARDGITRGKQPNFLMLDGRHLYAVLNDEIDLLKLFRSLRRELADKGRPYVPLPELTETYGA